MALRVEWLRERHTAIRDEVLAEAERFEAERGYRPPYWTLVEMARAAR